MPRGSAAFTASSKRSHHLSHSHHSSNGHLNGSVTVPLKRLSRSRSSSNSAVSPPAALRPPAHESPSANHGQQQQEQQQEQQLQHGQHHSYNPSDASSISSAGENYNEWNTKTSDRRYSDGLGDDMNMATANDTMMGGEHRKFDFHPTSDKAKLARNHITVLPSFPLLDSITLLIIFLQLPSTVLTIIHFLFATMTFVPPSTTLLSASTTSTYPSFTQLLLQGSAGSPSILTVILADVLVALLSIFLWPSARAFLIDFAQAVMAISLGAGNTGQTGGTIKNAAVCAGVISSAKVIGNNYDFNGSWNVHSNQHSNSCCGSALSGLSGISGGSASWIRNALAVHIVAQGIMRALRSWLIGRPVVACSGDGSSSNPTSALPKDVNSIIGKQRDKDPESGQTAQITQPGSSLPSSSDTNSRRKKKTYSIVRSRQPLWATLASTIVHIAKEVEQSQAISEAANLEGDGNGNNIEHKGLPLDGRVWITKIGSSEISFGADHFPNVVVEESDSICKENGQEMPTVTGDIGIKVPFSVRVNGIVWPQTDIIKGNASANGDDIAESGKDEWTVDISGLTPSTEYDFEFVRTRGGVAFYRTSACTLPAQASSVTSVTSPQPSRPLSPVTTLVNTLQQANTALIESKARLKRTRKENNRRLASIRSDIDTLKARLGSGDKGEERARRRVLSLREFVRRAEEDAEKMSKELGRLDQIPEEVEREWKQKKQLWQEEQKRLHAVESKFEEAKVAAGRHASAVESEAASLSNKQEKFTSRLSKLRAELDKLITENASSQDQKAIKEAEREALAKHRAAMEAEFSEAITKTEKKMQEYRLQSGENWNMVASLEQAAALQAQVHHIPQFPPSTPESGPRTRGSAIVTVTTTPPGFGPMPNLVAANLANPNRERSSSLLSIDSLNASDTIGVEQQQNVSSRPLLASLSAIAPIGYAEKKPTSLTTLSLGNAGMGLNLGPIARPGFAEKLGTNAPVALPAALPANPAAVAPGRLMTFGELH